jgi:hypothetical protein
MSALNALALARAHGVRIDLKGDRVRLLSQGPPPDGVLAALKAAKGEIIALMTPDASGATGIHYWAAFDESFADRLAASLEPELARLEAFEHVFEEWLKRSFDLIDAALPHSCAYCGRTEASNPLLPFGPNAHGRRAWVHDQCHQPWRNARQERALAALSAYGIEPPAAWLIAKAESEECEREILAWWRMRPATCAREFDVAWAKRGLEAIRDLGFRAYHDVKGARRIVDATGEERPPPPHAIKGLGRIKLGLGRSGSHRGDLAIRRGAPPANPTRD